MNLYTDLIFINAITIEIIAESNAREVSLISINNRNGK